jgi:signal transduction histidine kinase
VVVIAVAAIYFVSAKLGFSLAFVAEQVTAVWPPTGIALAAILLFGYQAWPGIAIGAFAANATANEPVLTACGIAAGNTLEAVIAAALLRRIVGFDNAIERVKDAIGLIVIAAVISTTVSATIGVTSLYLGGVHLPGPGRTIEWSDFWSLWPVWWIGDALGALVVAPVLLTWATGYQSVLKRPIEMYALVGGLLLTSWVAFLGGFTSTIGAASLAYIVFPFVIWAALRFGQPGATAVTLLASGGAIWATLGGLGPFGAEPIQERLLLLQVFMGVVAVTSLMLGAALAERRRAQELLQEADRRKDEFLATLAHELRNPLAPIRTGVDLLRMGQLQDAEASEVLDMLDRQVHQTTRMVDDLMDVSRLTRGKVELRLEPVDLRPVVEQAVETCRPVVRANGHELQVEFSQEPLVLRADPIRLAQVFVNLLNNAAKYSDRGGAILLTAHREGDDGVVRVRDSGHGIDHNVLPHIFELFVQGDKSLTRVGGGLGIGLTLVRSLVQMHGGRVEALSEGIGRGSEFIVRLPLATGAAESVASRKVAPGPEPSPANRHILVVDDNVDAARSLVMLLRAEGHHVRSEFSGAAALKTLEAWRPDVVLLDIGLPQMDGYEVARRIRKCPAGSTALLIAVTGWGQPEDRKRSTDAGFDFHVTKPVELSVLAELLRGSKPLTYDGLNQKP